MLVLVVLSPGEPNSTRWARFSPRSSSTPGFRRTRFDGPPASNFPGYYRPTKKWDLVVLDRGVLVAAIEFKSQVGPSFGNNFNNRTEEAIGNAVDIWRAYEEGTFGEVRPWLGYVFLLENSEGSTRPVRINDTAFPVDPVFINTSYMDRYRILCQRLVRERLYDAACFVVSSRDADRDVYEPDPGLGFANFIAAVAGRVAYIKALGSA